jgi:hypothetical protein
MLPCLCLKSSRSEVHPWADPLSLLPRRPPGLLRCSPLHFTDFIQRQLMPKRSMSGLESIFSHLRLGSRQTFFHPDGKKRPSRVLVSRFCSDLGFYPSGEPMPSLAPRGALGDSGREKSGDGPALSAREHANPTFSSQTPLPLPSSCSVAAGTTPRQSTGPFPALRRPSSHQHVFHRYVSFIHMLICSIMFTIFLCLVRCFYLEEYIFESFL